MRRRYRKEKWCRRNGRRRMNRRRWCRRRILREQRLPSRRLQVFRRGFRQCPLGRPLELRRQRRQHLRPKPTGKPTLSPNFSSASAVLFPSRRRKHRRTEAQRRRPPPDLRPRQRRQAPPSLVWRIRRRTLLSLPRPGWRPPPQHHRRRKPHRRRSLRRRMPRLLQRSRLWLLQRSRPSGRDGRRKPPKFAERMIPRLRRKSVRSQLWASVCLHREQSRKGLPVSTMSYLRPAGRSKTLPSRTRTPTGLYRRFPRWTTGSSASLSARLEKRLSILKKHPALTLRSTRTCPMACPGQ
mmetsp:Transcript_26472/g.76442  ORF Transcript_26472/g.76442 Transcript_26472/m.76442 type:complete len:296 (+) Transcript_26472:4457-5344(+)